MKLFDVGIVHQQILNFVHSFPHHHTNMLISTPHEPR